jgi:pimeloyl-ACP methyl ester carboxylesterase
MTTDGATGGLFDFDKAEPVAQTTERQRVATLRKQRIATLLGEINVHVVGNGPAMVCWPSLLMTGQMWRGQVDHFASNHQMVLIDSPGHGESDPLNRHFTLEECALCLSQILDQLEIEDCVLVGNSWGGMMGGVFVALYPSRTRAAVLMNCTASGGWLAPENRVLTDDFSTAPTEYGPQTGRQSRCQCLCRCDDRKDEA